MKGRGKKKEEAVKLPDYVKSEVFKFAHQCNVYSSLVRGLVSVTLLDLERKLKLHEDERRERGRSPLEELLTLYSREASKVLNEIFGCRGGAAEFLEEAKSWVEEVYSAACDLFSVVLLLNLETRTRLLVHAKSPYMPLEIGLAWHPLLNLPYIPATTLKGAVRAHFKRGRLPCGLSLEDLMGSRESRGMLIFSDAVPTKCEGALLEPDVVTPHYSEVEGRIRELDARPRPLVFPVVAPGVRFSAVVAVDCSHEVAACLAAELPQRIAEALGEGIGARVSVGYGRMKVSLVSVKRPGVMP